MADEKISERPALTSASIDDLLAIVDDPGGTPVTKKITVADFLSGVLITYDLLFNEADSSALQNHTYTSELVLPAKTTLLDLQVIPFVAPWASDTANLDVVDSLGKSLYPDYGGPEGVLKNILTQAYDPTDNPGGGPPNFDTAGQNGGGDYRWALTWGIANAGGAAVDFQPAPGIIYDEEVTITGTVATSSVLGCTGVGSVSVRLWTLFPPISIDAVIT